MCYLRRVSNHLVQVFLPSDVARLSISFTNKQIDIPLNLNTTLYQNYITNLQMNLENYTLYCRIVMNCVYLKRRKSSFIRHGFSFRGPDANSSRPMQANIRQYALPSLASMIGCRLLGTKPLLEPVMVHCKLGVGNQFQWNSNSNAIIVFKMTSLIMSFAKWRSFC